MALIFWSIVFILIFFALLVLTINYAIFLWETKKVENLTGKNESIRVDAGSKNDILFRTTANREFTSLDYNKSVGKKPSSGDKDKSLMVVDDDNYPEWVNKSSEIAKSFKKNAWETIKKLVKNLINLAKPITKSKAEIIEERVRQKKQEEVDETVENIVSAGSDSEDKIVETVISDEEYFEKPEGVEEEKADTMSLKDGEVDEDGQDDDSEATINIAGKAEKDDKDMTLFEKLEARVLAKLKRDGLDNYDIWLELGDLYIKFGEKEKAREVFALVLKHAEGSAKEMARNRLIGLS